MRRGLIQVAVIILVGAAMARGASAQVTVGGGGGVYKPYKGTAGFNVFAHGLARVAKNWDVGGEIEYRNFKAELLNVDDVGIDTIAIHALTRYLFPLGPVHLYVGAGLGIDLNIIDGNKIEDRRNVSVTDFGTGIGVLGLAGLDFHVTDAIALFAEGRAGYDLQLTNQSDDLDADNLGGITGAGGIRWTFGGPVQ